MFHYLYLYLIPLILLASSGSTRAQGELNNTARINAKVSIHGKENPAFFRAVLEGAQEVPPVTTNAKATGIFGLNENELSYQITVNGLSGPINAAHFHNAAAGSNGGVVRAIAFDGNTATGTWKADDAQPLTSALLAELKAGRIYVNIHTAVNPGGEIRGQVTRPSGDAYWTGLDGAQEVVSPLSAAPPAGATAPSVDNVGFPEGYKNTYTIFYEMDRLDNRQRRVIYANDRAASVQAGQPFPYGSILVMETHPTLQDDLGHVRRDDHGRFVTTGAAPTLFVMRKEEGFGEAYGNIRNGEWEYVAYRSDGTTQTPPSRTTGCATCHLNAHPENDFVFRKGLAFSQKNAGGTAAFWMEGNSLRYQITVKGLSGPVTEARLYNAAPGVSGIAVHDIAFTGNTAAGAWEIPPALLTELKAGKIFVNLHTAANPRGEIRGQVFPASAFEGLEVSFARSIAGRNLDFSWKGLINAQGEATVDIHAQSLRGASGYYRARLTNIFTRSIIVENWGSIPVQGSRAIELRLPKSGPAAIAGPFFGTPIQAAGKPTGTPTTLTLLPGTDPAVPSLVWGTIARTPDDGLELPVHLANARDLYGGELTLHFDPAKLALRGGRIGNVELAVTPAGPGSATLALEGLPPAEQTELVLTFHSPLESGPADLSLNGLIYDRHILPFAELATETRLSLNGEIPGAYALYPNTPNPFNPATQIRYDLPHSGRVRLAVYNPLGQEIARLVDTHQSAGAYAVTWTAEHLASGLYFYRLEAGTFEATRKLLLIK